MCGEKGEEKGERKFGGGVIHTYSCKGRAWSHRERGRECVYVYMERVRVKVSDSFPYLIRLLPIQSIQRLPCIVITARARACVCVCAGSEPQAAEYRLCIVVNHALHQRRAATEPAAMLPFYRRGRCHMSRHKRYQDGSQAWQRQESSLEARCALLHVPNEGGPRPPVPCHTPDSRRRTRVIITATDWTYWSGTTPHVHILIYTLSNPRDILNSHVPNLGGRAFFRHSLSHSLSLSLSLTHSLAFVQDSNVIVQGPIGVRNSKGRWRNGIGTLIPGKLFIFKVRSSRQFTCIIE